MIALVLAVAQAVASPMPACSGADVAIARVHYRVLKGSATIPDRILIGADVVNLGPAAQREGIAQHVELMRDGTIVATEKVRRLRAGERYPVEMRVFRNVADRGAPLEVMVRYVADDPRAAADNCNPANDSVVKIF